MKYICLMAVMANDLFITLFWNFPPFHFYSMPCYQIFSIFGNYFFCSVKAVLIALPKDLQPE